MKNSLIIISFFAIGLMIGLIKVIPMDLIPEDITLYVLYILLFFLGIGIGGEIKVFNEIKQHKGKVLIIPAGTILGTYAGVMLYSFLIPSINYQDSLAIGSGFGYYSLSSVLITEYSGEKIGAIALGANIFREILTLLFSPFLVILFGKLAPIYSGGATSMDTTLPVIIKNSGKEFSLIAIFNGLILSFLVPILISIIYEWF
ncbi:lysine exporter LysO family protein [Bacteroidota bacterium]